MKAAQVLRDTMTARFEPEQTAKARTQKKARKRA
jgi:hypothetical protein